MEGEEVMEGGGMALEEVPGVGVEWRGDCCKWMRFR